MGRIDEFSVDGGDIGYGDSAELKSMSQSKQKKIKAWAVIDYRNQLKKSGGIMYLIYRKKEEAGFDKFRGDKVVPCEIVMEIKGKI